MISISSRVSSSVWETILTKLLFLKLSPFGMYSGLLFIFHSPCFPHVILITFSWTTSLKFLELTLPKLQHLQTLCSEYRLLPSLNFQFSLGELFWHSYCFFFLHPLTLQKKRFWLCAILNFKPSSIRFNSFQRTWLCTRAALSLTSTIIWKDTFATIDST